MIIIDLVTLALAKKYTKETISGIGAIKGEAGKSAYQIAIENGFIGTETEWLESLKGAKGDPGNDYILTDADKAEIANIVINEYDSSLMAILGGDGSATE